MAIAKIVELSPSFSNEVTPVTLHRVQRENGGDIDVAVADARLKSRNEGDETIVWPLAAGARLEARHGCIEVARLSAIATEAGARVIGVGTPGYVSSAESESVGLLSSEAGALLRGDFSLQAEAQLTAVEEILADELEGDTLRLWGYSAGVASVAAMAKYLALRAGKLPMGSRVGVSQVMTLDAPNLLHRSLSMLSAGVAEQSKYAADYFAENKDVPHPEIDVRYEAHDTKTTAQAMGRLALAQNLPVLALRRGVMQDVVHAIKNGDAIGLRDASFSFVRAANSSISSARHHEVADQLMRYMGAESEHIELANENHAVVHSLRRVMNLTKQIASY